MFYIYILKNVIGDVVYLQFIGVGGLGFIFSILFGKGKFVFSGGNIIYWIELCVVVFGVEVLDVIKELLGVLLECF